jgi:arylformamidase
MTLIDITRTLHPGLPVWPTDPPFSRQPSEVPAGDRRCVSSTLTLGSHAGTHVDAPAHLLPGEGELDPGDEAMLGGAAPQGPPPGIEQLDLGVMLGPARVLDMRGQPLVTGDLIRALPDCPQRVLLRTDNSSAAEFLVRDFVALDPEAAGALVSRACLLVGIDGPSIDPDHAPDLPAHRVLLGAGVVVLEGLDLSRAEPGDYELICLPLRIRDADGAPARVVLRRQTS